MPESVDPRHLLLIGAGPGVGAGVVRRFGREGFRSTLIARGARLEQLAAELRGAGLEIEAVRADIADPTATARPSSGSSAPQAPPVSPSTTLPCRILARSSTRRSDGSGPLMTSMSSAPSSQRKSPHPYCGPPAPAHCSSPAAVSPTIRCPHWRPSPSGRPRCARGDLDRRRCPRKRRPCRYRHDRRLGGAWDGVRSRHHRRTLFRPRTPTRRRDRPSTDSQAPDGATRPRQAWSSPRSVGGLRSEPTVRPRGLGPDVTIAWDSRSCVW